MSDINQIVQVNITRQSASASLPGFGVPAIIAQFLTSKTKTAFTRARYYFSTAEMLLDEWQVTDSVYLAAVAIFSQPVRVPKLMVGRLDSGDASIAAGLDAIRAEQDDWYAYGIVGQRGVKFTLSTDLITGNVITSTINGIDVAPVTYATSHAATMAAWKAAIETAITGSTATVSGDIMTVVHPSLDLNIATATVTDGASRPTASYAYPLDATKKKAAMAWTEQQKKQFFLADSDVATYAPDTGVAGTACLAEFAKLSNYERTSVVFHTDNTQYPEFAWMGKELPYDPGLRTWAFKTLTGVTPSILTTGQENLVRGKNANVYTTTAAVSNMYAGTCAKASTYIDDIRGLDWLDTTIKLDLFNTFTTSGKVPFTDAGIQKLVGILKGSLSKAVTATVLDEGYTVTYPKAADVSAADKAARRLTGVSFQATLAGAVHSIIINGTVSA